MKYYSKYLAGGNAMRIISVAAESFNVVWLRWRGSRRG
jgi:hypothetical protein